jgi:hypothetical protein
MHNVASAVSFWRLGKNRSYGPIGSFWRQRISIRAFPCRRLRFIEKLPEDGLQSF